MNKASKTQKTIKDLNLDDKHLKNDVEKLLFDWPSITQFLEMFSRWFDENVSRDFHKVKEIYAIALRDYMDSLPEKNKDYESLSIFIYSCFRQVISNQPQAEQEVMFNAIFSETLPCNLKRVFYRFNLIYS